MEKEYSRGYFTFSEGVSACIPTILGYLSIGIAAGVVGKSAGLTLIEIGLLSVIVYAGSAQFIICGMLLIGANFSAIILTTFFVNFRHFLMSMSVASYFKEESMLKSIGIGTLLTDESYGVLVTALQKNKVSVSWTNGLNVTAYVSWIFATLIGGVIGNWLPNPEIFGLDFALVAMFIGLIASQLDFFIKKEMKKTAVILVSVVGSFYLLMAFFSAEISVIAATLIGCSIGVIADEP